MRINSFKGLYVIPLYGGGYTVVDKDVHIWAKTIKWSKAGEKNLYASCSRGYLHRLIMLPGRGGKEVDHINGDTFDNRRKNLRVVSRSANHQNRNTNSSVFVGVRKLGRKWDARITYNKKGISLGRHDTEEQAALAYDKKARELFGPNARLNIPRLVIYCAGPISYCSYDEATLWRDNVKQMLSDKFEILSPMRGKEWLKNENSISPVGYDNRPISSSEEIFCRDTGDVQSCNIILVNFLDSQQISAGTMFEIGMAWTLKKEIIIVLEDGNIHNHIFVHQPATKVFNTINDAILYIKESYNT